jgi:hypothetical protein
MISCMASLLKITDSKVPIVYQGLVYDFIISMDFLVDASISSPYSRGAI